MILGPGFLWSHRTSTLSPHTVVPGDAPELQGTKLFPGRTILFQGQGGAQTKILPNQMAFQSDCSPYNLMRKGPLLPSSRGARITLLADCIVRLQRLSLITTTLGRVPSLTLKGSWRVFVLHRRQICPVPVPPFLLSAAPVSCPCSTLGSQAAADVVRG